MKTQIKQYENLLLSLLIVTSPMYWFFGVSPMVFYVFKISLVIISVFLALRHYNKFNTLRYFELITITILMSILLILALLGIGKSDVFFISSSYPFLYYIVLLFTFRIFFIRGEYVVNIEKVINFINAFIVFITSIIIVSYIFGLNLTAPSEFNNFPIAFSGFGSLRTGWSAGLAMFVGGNVYFVLSGVLKENKLMLLSVLMVIMTQYLSGGRGGLLTSLVIVLYYLITNRSYFRIFTLAALLVALVISNTDLILEHFRLDRGISDSENGGLSAGRTIQYTAAFDLFLDNNLLPYGAYGYMEDFKQLNILNSIHNVWIRLTIENSLLFTVTLIAFIFHGIYKTSVPKPAKNILLLMLITTLFEPAAVIVNVNNYLMWWLVFSFNSYFNSLNQENHTSCEGNRMNMPIFKGLS